MTRHRKIGFALLVAFIVGSAGTAQATSFNLGNVSGPSVLSGTNKKDVGPFTDNYYFTIDPGVSLLFSARILSNSFRYGGIYDLDGTLSGSGINLDGEASLISPGLYPTSQVTFLATLLGPGTYKLSLFGTSTLYLPSYNDYYATITLAAPTPLPPALFLMLTALGALGWFGRRQSEVRS